MRIIGLGLFGLDLAPWPWQRRMLPGGNGPGAARNFLQLFGLDLFVSVLLHCSVYLLHLLCLAGCIWQPSFGNIALMLARQLDRQTVSQYMCQ